MLHTQEVTGSNPVAPTRPFEQLLRNSLEEYLFIQMHFSDIDKLFRQKLSDIYPERESASIARLVLEHLTGMGWVQIRLNFEKEFTDYEENRISEIITRLEKHEPVQYILGETEFYGLKLKVRPGVLIPRGETEELVQWIIKAQGSRLKAQVKAQGSRLKAQGKEEGKKGLRVLDIGCGSGAIALALAKHLPDAEVIAADISEAALQLTRENAALNNLNITTITLDILAPTFLVIPAKAGTSPLCTEPYSVIPANAGTPPPCSEPSSVIPAKAPLFPCALSLAPFDFIVSNPPYVPLSEMTSMDLHVVEYEPETALFVPDDNPLLFYKAIAEFAAYNLNPDGQVFVEIHDRLGAETSNVFRKWFSIVDLRKDIHGKDRMIHAYHG